MKPLRIFLGIFWCLFVASAQPAPSAQLTLSGSPGLAPAGTNVTITIALSGGGGPAALQWDMAGVPTGATVTSLATGKTVQCTATRCVLSGLNLTAIADGPVAQIQYAQPATAPAESLTAILSATPAGAAGAALTAGTSSHCDLNGDGKIDATDVGLAVTQTLGAAAGAQPNILDVVRVIIAAFGGVCLR